MEALNNLDAHWVWLAIGLILASAEMALPGLFLIWLAGAALITGIAAWLLPIGLPVQIVLFAVLAIVAVFTGRTYLRANPVAEADPKMNRRGARLTGNGGGDAGYRRRQRPHPSWRQRMDRPRAGHRAGHARAHRRQRWGGAAGGTARQR